VENKATNSACALRPEESELIQLLLAARDSAT
jgi:hypothetical protein